ncbi:MAG: hypothetical protein M2R45_01957 [Verrucomicrobia subdivision 3 bacterium]|nr:hypothetical protein [Limisphaerales bacterium]MCS1416176.1 hypothetical protein [Limisphaerales bacterium]
MTTLVFMVSDGGHELASIIEDSRCVGEEAVLVVAVVAAVHEIAAMM